MCCVFFHKIPAELKMIGLEIRRHVTYFYWAIYIYRQSVPISLYHKQISVIFHSLSNIDNAALIGSLKKYSHSLFRVTSISVYSTYA